MGRLHGRGASRRRGVRRSAFSKESSMHWSPVLKRTVEDGEVVALTLGHALVDDYLGFVGARARPNTLLATAFDLKVFFSAVGKDPAQVTRADVFTFLKSQRTSHEEAKIVRLADGERGLSARTIARRLSTISGLFAYLLARDDTALKSNPVPRGLARRRPAGRRGHGGVPLIRTPRTLPRLLAPVDVDALMGALRTHRDRAMVEAMLLGGLRRCEVLGLRLGDVNAGERRLFIAHGKGGRQRIVPVSARFFATLGRYMDQERPRTSATEQIFVVLKGPRQGRPLSADGLDEILDSARHRAGLVHA